MRENYLPIKVGFGPRTDWNSFYQSGEKVAEILGHDARFVCGFFGREPWSLDEMVGFDVLIFIKHYPSIALLRQLKRAGKILILDFHDKALWPSLYERNVLRKWLKKIYYLKTERRIKRQVRTFDVCFVAAPGLVDVLKNIGARPHYLARQIYNHQNEFYFKQHNTKTASLVLYWTGGWMNQEQNHPILPVLKRLRDRYHCTIVYSSGAPPVADFIDYRKWSRDGWEKELLEADIAFRWRDTSVLQELKDPNKVLSYMAAGLPVVTYPTESEKVIAQDGTTALFAYTPEEFETKMITLITHPALRKQIGEAAHRIVWEKHSLGHQVEEIKKILLELREQRT